MSGIRRTIAESGAQAVVLDANAAGALPIFAEMLSEPDPSGDSIAEDVQLIGLTRWDIPRATLRHEGLQGGWFAQPDPNIHEMFVMRYAGKYGSRPHPLAGLAYDGIAIIGTLVGSGGRNPLSGSKLTRDGGFVGVNGIFRLRPDGTTERKLTISRINKGRVETVDPAARSFVGVTCAGT